MIRNYFKVAWRGLIKNKAFSVINIGGLAVGMAVVMLIGLWIYDEVSFNRVHRHYGDVAQVMKHATYEGSRNTDASASIPLATELRVTFPDDFKYVVPSLGIGQHKLELDNREFLQAGNFMGAEAPELLTLDMIKGIRQGLANPNSVFLSESLADKLFAGADPMDKIIKIDNNLGVKVTGVYKDLPDNSSFKDMTFVAPFDLWLSSQKDSLLRYDWNSEFIGIYVQKTPNANFESISAKIKNITQRHVSGDKALEKASLFLHPMNKWHLYSKFEDGAMVTSEQLRFVWFYAIIGFFVLLLACINFMNLSTARSVKRAKEVGIRKSIGSLRYQLIGHFFCESILVSLFSFVLAIGLVLLILPWFNGVAGKEVGIMWLNPWFWMAGLAFIFLTGLLAGSYPAFYLSSFKPVSVLKGTFRAGKLAGLPRKILVVLQFTVSVGLMIGTIIVYRQIQFAKDRPIGYTREGLLTTNLTVPDLQQKYEVLSHEMQQTGVISGFALSQSPLTDIWNTVNGFIWNGPHSDTSAFFGIIGITPGFGKTVGWNVVAGRDFFTDFQSDQTGIVVNEAAVKQLHMDNPVGQTVSFADSSRTFTIIGVVKDMVMRSPFKPAVPSFFYMGGGNWAAIRIDPAVSAARAIPKIKEALKRVFPAALIDLQFADENYAVKFAAEERVGNLAGFFTLLAVLISCLGLFGLVSFVAEQRIKEIAVRKVLGASVNNLWMMLSKDFIILVVISCAIAIPLAYYFMYEWLQQYEYRVKLSWWIFVGAVFASLIITLVTVSYQSLKTALMNPVNSLRSE